jgi:hypothetical protein
MTLTGGRILLIGTLGVALLALSGCGNASTAGPVGTPQAIVSSAPDITLGAGTAEISISSPHADATGVIDLTTHDGRLAVSTKTDTSTASVVIVGGIGYAKASATTNYRMMQGPLPLSSLIDPNVLADGSDEVLPSSDPWADIDLVRGTTHILSDGGGESDGASTIGYTLTIDPALAIKMTPGAARQAALKALVEGRTKPFTIEVWIDSQFRIRQIEVAANFAAPDFKSETPPTRVDGETIGTDVFFLSFGVPVPTVTVPPNLST